MAKIQLDFKILKGLVAHGATKRMCADILDCSEDTVERRVKETFTQTFKEFRESRMSVTKVKLIQKAIDMAMGGNVTMLIFCLKNLCEWSDRRDVAEISSQSITLSYKLDDE